MQQDEDHTQPLFNALPPAVVALALAIFGVELVISAGQQGLAGGAGGVGWRVQAIRDFAYPGGLLDWVIQNHAWTSPELRRFVTYPFVHLSFTHALFVVVFLLALGKMVGEVFGNLAVLVIFFVSAIFGAVIYDGLAGSAQALVGGYPAVYGLIGAYSFLLWVHYGVRGENQIRAFSLIGFLLGIQLLFGLIFGGSRDWVADVSGFVMGFALAPMLAPGAARRLLDKLRQR